LEGPGRIKNFKAKKTGKEVREEKKSGHKKVEKGSEKGSLSAHYNISGQRDTTSEK